MSLQLRVGLLVAVATVLAAAIIGVGSSGILVRGFDEAEQHEAMDHYQRAERFLEHDAERLMTQVADWAVWDDTLDYVRTGSSDYVRSNLGVGTFEGLGLDSLVVLDLDGDVVYAGRLARGSLVSVTHDRARELGTVEGPLSPETGQSGLMLDRDGNLLRVARHAITASDGEATPAGVLTMTELVDEAAIGELADLLGVAVVVAPDLEGGEPRVELTDEEVTVSGPLPGIDGQTVGRLTVTEQRNIHAIAMDSRGRLLLVVVLTFLLLGAGFLVVTGRYVRRLRRLRNEAIEIGSGASQHVTVDGSDEIGDVSAAIDEMLQSLGEVRNEIEAQNIELLEANRAKDDFVATVSHELRTPITVIEAALDTLGRLGSEMPEGDRRLLVERASRQSERLRRLVEDFLVIARLERGAVRLRADDVRLDGLMLDVVRDLDLSDECRVEVGDLAVYADPDHVYRVVENLLTNARRYGSAPYEIAARMRPGDRVELLVRDHGSGVAPEFVSRMFSRFSQASTGDRRMSGGTGLGLSIVRELSELNGGGVRYEDAPGGGAVFIVDLRRGRSHPRADTDAEVAATTAP